MPRPVTLKGNLEAVKGLLDKRLLFVCSISSTRVAEVQGITVAGANSKLIAYTPAVDAEILLCGKCLSIPTVPATPDGKPTPALITRSAVTMANIPCLVVDAGAEIKPKIPFISVGAEGPTGNVLTQNAVSPELVRRVFDNARRLGETLAELCDCLVLAESIPGGTTTACATLCALGVDARGRMSSSMNTNPKDLKVNVVTAALERANVHVGDLMNDPFDAVGRLGDLMIPTVAGLASGGGHHIPIVLAGGTQMAAVLGFLKASKFTSMNKLLLCTTTYVAEDNSADLAGLVKEIYNVPLILVDPGLANSRKPGLRAYAEGFVKEGVGAGGAVLAAILKSQLSLSTDKLLAEIEKNYGAMVEGTGSPAR